MPKNRLHRAPAHTTNTRGTPLGRRLATSSIGTRPWHKGLTPRDLRKARPKFTLWPTGTHIFHAGGYLAQGPAMTHGRVKKSPAPRLEDRQSKEATRGRWQWHGLEAVSQRE